MSRRMRSAAGVLLGFGVVAACRPAAADEPVPSLRAEAALIRKLDSARRHLAAGAWPEVSHSLQALLDLPEDILVPVRRPGGDGREVLLWMGIRGEAARLLGTLPAAGREFYQTTYGPQRGPSSPRPGTGVTSAWQRKLPAASPTRPPAPRPLACWPFTISTDLITPSRSCAASACWNARTPTVCRRPCSSMPRRHSAARQTGPGRKKPGKPWPRKPPGASASATA